MKENGYGILEATKETSKRASFRIPLLGAETKVAEALKAELAKDFPAADRSRYAARKRSGPRSARSSQNRAWAAIIVSLFGILVYVSWRFELKFAVGAIIALAHDVLVTLGIFSIFNREISLFVVAALLTIVGYSINDTIVVFDRIGRTSGFAGAKRYEGMLNVSINETLSRTIITVVTVFIVTMFLLFMGGRVRARFRARHDDRSRHGNVLVRLCGERDRRRVAEPHHDSPQGAARSGCAVRRFEVWNRCFSTSGSSFFILRSVPPECSHLRRPSGELDRVAAICVYGLATRFSGVGWKMLLVMAGIAVAGRDRGVAPRDRLRRAQGRHEMGSARRFRRGTRRGDSGNRDHAACREHCVRIRRRLRGGGDLRVPLLPLARQGAQHRILRIPRKAESRCS